MNETTFVVVPAYNEAKNIQNTLDDLLKYGYKIVVVDDGSQDETVALARAKDVSVVCQQINRGQGAALQTGTEFVLQNGARIVIHFDADGQFLANEISDVIQPLINNEVDIVLGSRFLQKNIQMPWLKRKIIHPISRLINYFLTGLKLSDAHCGLRAMNRLAAEKIVILQDGMSHNTEIVAQIKKNNLRFKELPISVIYKEFGQGVGGGLKILWEIFIHKIIKS
ncbi:MAG TPA: glycosyltransferase family 2 protein [bacterium]|mgnify:CR=1 FL=1|nr:glycosyltransferase family 2 protein [bacterium]